MDLKLSGKFAGAAGAALCLALTGCAVGGDSSPSPSQSIAVTNIGEGYTVQVQVGNANPVPVQLDTGSSGLRIFQEAVGSDVQTDGVNLQADYGDGTVYLGQRATTPITIGGITSDPVDIHIVDKAKCESSSVQDECTPEISEIISEQGLYGIMGVDTYPDNQDIANPLPYLSSDFSQYTLHLVSSGGSSITSGAYSGTSTISYDLSQATSDAVGAAVPAVSGTTYWDSTVNGCWAFDNATPACTTTIFDSGTTLMDMDTTVSGAPSSTGVLNPGAGTLNFFSSADANGSLWSITAGSDGELNGIQVQDPDSGEPSAIAGDPIFNAFDINYDLGGGSITLYPNPNTVDPSGSAVPSGSTVPSESPGQ